MRWSIAALTTVVLLSSAAAQEAPEELCVIEIAPDADFARVVVEVDEVYDEDRKRRLAQQVDSDDDGTVTAQEVQTYHNASLLRYDAPAGTMAQLPSEHEHKRLVVDDKWPRTIEFRMELAGAVGPVEDSSNWRIKEVRTYEFEPEQLETHRIMGGVEAQPEARAVVEFVVVVAPHEWWVHRVNDTLYDERVVSLESFDTHRSFTIDFSDEPGKDYWLPASGGSPGLGGFGALVAVCVGLAFGRPGRAARVDSATAGPPEVAGDTSQPRYPNVYQI